MVHGYWVTLKKYFQSVQYSFSTAAVYAYHCLHWLSGHNSNHCFFSPFSACSFLLLFNFRFFCFLTATQFFYFIFWLLLTVAVHLKQSKRKLTWHTGQAAFCLCVCVRVCYKNVCIDTHVCIYRVSFLFAFRFRTTWVRQMRSCTERWLRGSSFWKSLSR